MPRFAAPLVALVLAACTKAGEPQHDPPAPPNAIAVIAPSAIADAAPPAVSQAPAPPPSAAPSSWPKADLASFEAMNASDDPMHKTVILELRDFKAMSNALLGARSCAPPSRGLDLVRIEVTKLPSGTAKKLVESAGCRRVYGKITGWTGGGPNGLKLVDVTALLDAS